jgi:hypothetical protein
LVAVREFEVSFGRMRKAAGLYFVNQILIGEKAHFRCITCLGEYGSNGCQSGDAELQSHPTGSKKVSAQDDHPVPLLCSGHARIEGPVLAGSAIASIQA